MLMHQRDAHRPTGRAKHGSTSPECTPIVGFAMFAPAFSAGPSSGPEQAVVEPNQNKNDEADDRRV
jgi:hypothetical protein